VGQALLQTGRLSEAVAACEAGLALARPHGLSAWILQFRITEGRALAAAGRVADAAGCYREVLTLPECTGANLVSVIEALASLGGEADWREAIAVGLARMGAEGRVPAGACRALSGAYRKLGLPSLAAWAEDMERACSGVPACEEASGAQDPVRTAATAEDPARGPN
jgi:hypothetical protein